VHGSYKPWKVLAFKNSKFPGLGSPGNRFGPENALENGIVLNYFRSQKMSGLAPDIEQVYCNAVASSNFVLLGIVVKVPHVQILHLKSR